MPRFAYKALSANGEVLTGEHDADTRDAVIAHLRGQGHVPVNASEIRHPLNFSALESWLKASRGERTTRADVVLFTRELATLLQAGIPLDSALRMLEDSCGSSVFRRKVGAIRQSIQAGHTVAEALGEHITTFGVLYVSLIRAGEAGGTLATILERLANYLERMSALRAAVITALIYPAILLVVALASLLLLMTFVVPEFLPLFSDAGATLPLITQIVFGMAGLLRDFWWAMIAMLAGAGWGAARFLRNPEHRRRLDAALLRAPGIGALLLSMDTARFSHTLGTLLHSGVPLLSSIQLARDVIGNHAIAEGMEFVSTAINRGEHIASALRRSTRLPPRAVQLIEVGEESGQLPRMLEKVAEIYDREVETNLKRLLIILEPALILGLGGIIAIIIISILTAILGLNELVV